MKLRNIFTLLLICYGYVSAENTGLPQATLDQLDQKEQTMFDSLQNADAFSQLMGDDYITINADGVMEDKSQTADRIRNHPLPKADLVLTGNRRQRVYGNVAIRTGEARVSKGGILLADFLYTETWIHREERWQLIGWHGTMTGAPRHYPVFVTLVLLLLAAGFFSFIKKRQRVHEPTLSQGARR